MSYLPIRALAGALVAFGLLAPSAVAQSDTETIKSLTRGSIDKVLEHLGSETLTGVQKREQVRAAIDSISDMDLFAKLVLGRTHWTKATAEQRAEFKKVFADTVHLSMYEKLVLFTDEKVEIGEVTKLAVRGKPKYRIVVWIISKGKRTELAMLFAQREPGWRVYDVEIKGVSVRKSYGNQYADYLRKHTMAQLLTKMKAKAAELEAKANERDGKQ